MEKDQILENLATAIIKGNKDMARETAQNALRAGINPLEAVDKGAF